MKLKEKQAVILIFLNDEKKTSGKTMNLYKTMVENKADSSMYNNFFAELWFHDAEKGIRFCNVATIQLAT